MRTIVIKLYQFDELSDDAKQKAIENLYDINVDTDWWRFTVDNLKEENDKHFDITDIYFSHFHCQGAGAMFEYSGITKKLFHEAIDSLMLPNWKKAILKNGYCSGKGKHSGHYHHENECSHSINIETNNGMQYCQNIEDLFYQYSDNIENYIVDRYKEIARSMYKALLNEYEYLMTEEAVIETIKANEYEFTENGKLF